MAFHARTARVVRRFQIEDLIVQDASGVVFRAVDTETGGIVALRRFFPFGVDGGGLDPEEQAAYNIAVSRLAGLSHPSLRSVISGGCDPVDGMPFIATEWIEGEPLQEILSRGPLDVDAATALITQALEVCELLSHVLSEEAVWLETSLTTIVVGSQESGRGFTFWISPLKWLGSNDESRGLDSIVRLTEEIMGWTGQIVSDQAGRGMGGWVKWLHGVAATTTLLEARQALAASVGAEPPAPARNLVVKATTRPLIKPATPLRAHASAKGPLIIACSMALLVATVGAWLWVRQTSLDSPLEQPVHPPALASAERAATDTKQPTPAEVLIQPSKPVDTKLDEVNRRIKAISDEVKQAGEQEQEILARQQAAATANAGAIQWDHHELLADHDKKEAVVEGVIRQFGASSTGKSLYLHFTDNPSRNDARVVILIKGAPPDLSKEALEPLMGKKIRVRGKIDLQSIPGDTAFRIRIKRRREPKPSPAPLYEART